MNKEIKDKLKKTFGADAIEKIKKLFTGEAPQEGTDPGTKQEMKVDYVTKEGVKIKIEPELSEGGVVTVISEDGAQVPAPDGDVFLEDGTKITIAEGIVKAIEAAAAEAPMATSEEVQAAVAQFKNLRNEFVIQGKEIANLKKENAALKAKVDELSKNTAEKFSAFSSGIDELIDAIAPEDGAKKAVEKLPENPTGADMELHMRKVANASKV